jgi:hypothetical protein
VYRVARQWQTVFYGQTERTVSQYYSRLKREPRLIWRKRQEIEALGSARANAGETHDLAPRLESFPVFLPIGTIRPDPSDPDEAIAERV